MKELDNHEPVKRGVTFQPLILANHRNKQFGSILLTQPLKLRILAGFAIFFMLVICIFSWTFSTTRKVQVTGIILPDAGLIKVLPMQSGVMLERYVKEGQSVERGQALFVVSNERSNKTGETQKNVSDLLGQRRNSLGADVEQLKQQFKHRFDNSKQKIHELQQIEVRLKKQTELQERRVSLAEASFQRFENLKESQYISSAQLQDKESELIDQRQKLEDLRQSQTINQRDLGVAQGEFNDQVIQEQREVSAATRNTQALDQDIIESEIRREFIVRAPQSGIISTVNVEIGQTIAANSTLASLIPDGSKLIGEVNLSSKSIGFISPGKTTWLRYQAYPYQKFGQYKATIIEISHAALRLDELSGQTSNNANSAEILYRVRLKLDSQYLNINGGNIPLKVGMAFDASIILEERRLIDWIYDPISKILTG